MSTASQALDQITAHASHLDNNPANRLLGELLAELEMIDVKSVITDGLHEFLDDVQNKISDIHDAIQTTFVEYPTAGAKVLA